MAKKRRKPARQEPQPVRKNPAYSWVRIVRLLLVCGIIAYLVYRQQQEQQPAPPPLPDRPMVHVQLEESPEEKAKPRSDETEPSEKNEDSSRPAGASAASPALQTAVENVTIRDRDGEVVHQGSVDLTETIARIQRGERLDRFDHDGITFQNRERRLPPKSSGYYREWVHPTPELSGPGPQRIVTGKEGDYWYTPDHYRSFISLNRGDRNE